MDIKEKQARWAIERPLFEAKFIHSHLLPFFNFNENTGDYEIKDECLNTDTSEDRRLAYETLNTGWVMWLRAKRDAKAQAVPEGQAIVDVLAERKRQIEQEHYAIEHDDEYQSNELVRAAASYSEHVIARQWIYKDSDPEIYQSEEAPEFWPWAIEFWKPKSPRKDLVRAAALLLAEIERIDRTGPQEAT